MVVMVGAQTATPNSAPLVKFKYTLNIYFLRENVSFPAKNNLRCSLALGVGVPLYLTCLEAGPEK